MKCYEWSPPTPLSHSCLTLLTNLEGRKAPVVVIKTPRYFGPCPIPPKGLLKSHRRVLVDEREAENHAFLYPSWARNMYGNAWARIMYGNAEFQIFLLFGRLVLEKLNEKAVPPLRGRQRGETVFLEAVPTWGLDAGLRRRASRRRAGPPGGTWEGDTLSGGLKRMLLSIRSNPRLPGGTTETVMERWRRDGRSQPVWVTAEGSLPSSWCEASAHAPDCSSRSQPPCDFHLGLPTASISRRKRAETGAGRPRLAACP